MRYQPILHETASEHMVVNNKPAYKVSCIQFTFPNAYHVVNCKTKVSHSMWPTMEAAMQCMRDLNKAERRKIVSLKVVA